MAGRLASTIDDLESTNQALFRSNEELKQLDRMKSELLANVSHELRTPVTAIQGYTEALEGGLLGPVSDEQGRAFSIIERNVLRLAGMINQLLSYARLESGTIRLEPQRFDLLAVADDLVRTIKEARGPSLDLRYEVQGEVPEVYGDPNRISQVLDNLLTNAIKFTPEGGAIELIIKRDGADDVEVLVMDTGIGIAESEREKIFDRFYQVDASSTRKYGGIGLGLAIVRQILHAHGADISVEGEPRRGSTFRFCLPVAKSGLTSLGVQGEGAG
jgi:signal transduction histidine kinase